MKNLFFFLFFGILITSCHKREKDEIKPRLSDQDSIVITTYDSIEVFDETVRLGVVKVTYQNSKIISMNFTLDHNQPANSITKIDFHYRDDNYLDSTVEHENGQRTGDRYLYDTQKRISFRSYYHTEYAHRFIYKTDSVILKNYINSCSGSACEVTPEGFSMNIEKADTLVLNSQGTILSVNKQQVVYAADAPVLSLQDLYKLHYLTNEDFFLWSMLTNRKPIESVQGKTQNLHYQFDANNKVREIIYTNTVPQYSYSVYRRLVFHY